MAPKNRRKIALGCGIKACSTFRLRVFDGRHRLKHIRPCGADPLPEGQNITLSTPSVEDRFRKMNTGFHRLHIATFLFGALLCGPGLSGQSGSVTAEENFRAQPNGALLGQLHSGAPVVVSQALEDWLEFDLTGWVWTQSLEVVGRDNFDLVVSAADGENIRSAPSGDVLGRLEPGTLLQEVERVPGWVRVRRGAWIWSRSVDIETLASAAVEERIEAALGEEWTMSGEIDAAILSTPDGDTLAAAVPGANFRILAREGNWARVRLDGWLWLPESTAVEEESTILNDVTIEDVTSAPLEYRGRVLQWDVQFISLERAEKIRTDFYEGEPFLLTRMGRGEGIFVYVAIPPERLSEVEGLSPLERISVVGRVRTGAARLTGSPILELLALSALPR